MESRQLYEDDIYAWSEQQAAVLRRVAEQPGRIPHGLDLEHVAEEIEDLGRSRRDAAESFVRLILVHLIKLAVMPDADSARHWRSEIVTFQIELLGKLTSAMTGRIDLDRIWELAKRQARANLEEDGGQLAGSPVWGISKCPFDLSALSREDFDVDDALGRLMPAR